MGDPLPNENKNLNSVEHDIILWKEFTGGNMSAYEAIYARYVDDLYRYVYVIVKDKSHAEDVIHDVFTDLWSNRKNLGEIRSVRLYLFSSIKRRAFRKLKKEKQFTFFDQTDKGALTFEIVPPFIDEIINTENSERFTKKIRKFISGLSNRQREIIYLRFYQDMSYVEIAELLQLDQKYVYNLASKAFCVLRKTVPQKI